MLLFALYGGIPPIEAYPADQRERMRTYFETLNLRPRQEPGPERSRA
jgi:penicillin-binding protein 2